MAISSLFSTDRPVIKYWTEIITNSSSESGNSTNVTVNVYIKRTDSGYTTYGTGTVYCNIDGIGYTSNITTSHKVTSTPVRIFSRTLNVNHNTAGEKTLVTKAKISHSRINSDYNTFSLALPSLARGSTLGSISNFTIGDTIPITINREKATYTHRVTVKVGNVWVGEWTDVGTSVNITFNTTHKNRIYDVMPTSNAAIISFILTTYDSSGSRIGVNASRTANGAIPSDLKPSLSGVSIVEDSDVVKGLVTGHLQHNSLLKFSINGAAGVNGSKIESYRIQIGTKFTANESSGLTDIITESGTLDVVATVSDSRGMSQSYSTTIYVRPYHRPKITKFVVARTNSNAVPTTLGTYLMTDFAWSVSSIKTGSTEKNTVRYELQTRTRGTTTWVSRITRYPTDLTSFTTALDSGFGIDKTTEVQLLITDALNTTISLGIMTSSEVTMAWGKSQVGIGKVPTRGTLDIEGIAYAHGFGVDDTREINSTPGELMANYGRSVNFAFKRNTVIGNPQVKASNSYSHIIQMMGWTDGSGGYPTQISVGKGLAIRQGSGDNTWGAWEKVKIDNGYPEAGSGPNGRYVKHEDGTLICYVEYSISKSFDSAYGSFWRTTQTWVFPHVFVAEPSVMCSQFRWGTGLSWGGVANTSVSNGVLVGYDTAKRASGDTKISAIAVGRWY